MSRKANVRQQHRLAWENYGYFGVAIGNSRDSVLPLVVEMAI